MSLRSRPLALTLVLVIALALGGCRATGRAANSAFDWGGRTFTTNPVSAPFYYLGFGVFFVAGLPLDLFSLVATWIGWPDGGGEDYQGSALAPSIFLGVAGGTILGAPFFPFGLPWWNPDRDDEEAPPPPSTVKPASDRPAPGEPRGPAEAPPRAPEPARAPSDDAGPKPSHSPPPTATPDDPDEAPAGGGPRR